MKAQAPLHPALIAELRAIVGPQGLLLDPVDRWAYGFDNSRRQAMPQGVILVDAAAQVALLVSICHRESLPLIARGRGTGTTGATVPDQGGLVLSFERMNRILSLDAANRLAIVEPGVTNQALQEAAAQQGFFWPPDPTSAATCTLGGNLACNAAGPRAVKYGTPRENTLGLSAVTGVGEPLCTGVKTTKGVVGYDLTRLIIGSEGTLALITQVTLKLSPLPEAKATLRASYTDIHAAAAAVSAIMAQAVIPCALEFMDASAIAMARHVADLGLPAGTGALLMIEVDGTIQGIDEAATRVAQAAQQAGLLEIRTAASRAEVSALWRTRTALSPALRRIAPKKINEDVVVPVARLGAFIEGVEGLGQEHQIRIVNFGHAGNGNIHVNLLVNPDDLDEMARAERCLDAIFRLVLELEGTLSGEHGVGLAKRDFVHLELDPVALRLMHAIKRQFDPRGILNPGKTLPPLPKDGGQNGI